jgi:hypothetical protein
MLDYSIRTPSPLPYHLGFMIELTERWSSSMVSKARSWVQFHSATQFSAAHISPSLASAGSVGTATPEREQAVSTTVVCMQEGECWTIV